tara:strand:- start:252 stop:2015 length:1764 start_codon:yes stop_codon:yes gene_type:complete
MSKAINLNYNENYSSDNPQAFNFTQNFSDTIDIKPDSTVALYQAELTRKPIVITETSSITMTLRDSDDDDLNAGSLFITYPILIPIEKGVYTRKEFTAKLMLNAQLALDEVRTDNADIDFDSYDFAIDNDPLFFGLAITSNTTKNADMGQAVDNTEANSVVVSDGDISINDKAVVGNVNVGCTTFQYGKAPINPLCLGREIVGTPKGFLNFTLLNKSTTEDVVYDVAFGTVEQALQGDGVIGTLPTMNIEETDATAPRFPFVFRFEDDVTASAPICRVSVFANDNLSDWTIGDPLSSGGNMIGDFQIDSLAVNSQFAVSFYKTNNNDIRDSITGDRYYFRLHLVTIDNFSRDLVIANNNIVFDSFDGNHKISDDLINGINQEFIGAAPYSYSYSDGIYPIFCIYSEVITNIDDLGITNIEGSFIMNEPRHALNAPIMVNNYTLSIPPPLRDIFGSKSLILNACGYPRARNGNFGVVELFGDSTSYNIEIPNLPIQVYNSTKNKNNDIGEKRPIVFTVNNAFGDKINSQLNERESRIIRSIYPNILKPLALDNKKHILLNNFDIEIRRADTNVLATEITNCKIEILIN